MPGYVEGWDLTERHLRVRDVPIELFAVLAGPDDDKLIVVGVVEGRGTNDDSRVGNLIVG